MDGIEMLNPEQTDAGVTKQPAESIRRQGRVEMSISQIIEKAENEPATFRAAACWSVLAGVLMWASYYPLGWSPLAWVAVLPWLLLIKIERPTRGMLWAAYLGGLCFFLPALQWMRYGDPLMYFAWGALAFYVAGYIPIFLGLSRLAVHRWQWPLFLSAAIVWTGLEYFRGFLFTGFGWYYLGHTQYFWPELIQISDLVGAYGISFVMMLVAGAIAMQFPVTWLNKMGLVKNSATQQTAETGQAGGSLRSLVIATAVLLMTIGYGYWRCSQAEFTPGPRVALVQGDFKAALRIPPSQYEEEYLVHTELTGMAVQHDPDLIVWPEGMFRYALMQADPELTDADLSQLAPFPPENWHRTDVQQTLVAMSEKAGAAMVLGMGAYEVTADGFSQYNSAQLVTALQGLGPRYDKLHRVPFGEYIPGKNWPIISSFLPENTGLSPGKHATAFDHQGWRFAPVICFEDTVPHVTRKIVHSIETNSESGQPVDFLVNLSNDGWFAGSSEHDQHLITAQFRAVELRKPLVRAANMGISSCIDGNGQVIDPEVFLTPDPVNWEPREISYRDPETGRYRRKLNAVVVQTIPLDHRSSVYLWTGDWFAGSCFCCCLGLLLSRWWPRKNASKMPHPESATSQASQ